MKSQDMTLRQLQDHIEMLADYGGPYPDPMITKNIQFFVEVRDKRTETCRRQLEVRRTWLQEGFRAQGEWLTSEDRKGIEKEIVDIYNELRTIGLTS